MPPAKAHAFSTEQRQLHAEQIVRGDSVFEAVKTAGVFGDVSPDRASNLTGGIWGIVEAVRLDRSGDREIGNAWLGHDAAVFEIDLDDTAHPRKAEQDPVGTRQGSTRKRRARATR